MSAEIFETYPLIGTVAALVGLALIALFANFVIKVVMLKLVNRLLAYTPYGRDPELRQHGVVERLANVMPALVVSAGIAFVPNLPDFVVVVVRNVANATIILTVAMAISAIFNIADVVYHRRPQARLRPVKGYIQVFKIAVYVVAALLMLATLLDQSPLILLSGLGAMAAVLILVFQDTLLSLVAGIQISSTDMVRVGDWIEMPDQKADGDVIEIALHTVKVQNWDKTVTTIPIRKLVTEPFKNWRGMQESGGRRIKRSLQIDQSSIRFLTQDELNRLEAIGLLEHYLQKKRGELSTWNEKLGDKAKVLANTRRSTNIGTFRAYAEAYLRNHPHIHQNMTIMVRQLAPTPQGLPIELYAFTNTIAWVNYEGIQADIFDHLYSILAEFDLRVFQEPAGYDMQKIGGGEMALAAAVPA
ncbi:MAG: mechanosensitive ion channel protein MscS [Pelagibacterium sp. SCN 64-44]|nr:MAG: mechanosensitive ion channel protein MscS [Pelagibacterium sp. SCN 64-44]